MRKEPQLHFFLCCSNILPPSGQCIHVLLFVFVAMAPAAVAPAAATSDLLISLKNIF